jgi:predicted acylesterase/phospholipase RssA
MLEQRVAATGHDYDGFAGTSIGAVNAAYLAMAPRSKLPLYVEALKHMWLGIGTQDSIYTNWFLVREAAGVLYRNAFYDSTPLRELISSNVTDAKVRASGRKLRMGVVAYGSGEHRIITEADDDLAGWCGDSAAYPGFLLPGRREDDLWMDGGVRHITPIKAAIDAGADEIDVFLTSPLAHTIESPEDNAFGTKITALDVVFRSMDLMSNQVYRADIKMARMYNALARAGAVEAAGKREIKFTVYEPKKLFAPFSLGFNRDEIREMLEHGREVVQAGGEVF